MDKIQLNLLASTIVRQKLWASEEETEAWLKTPTGQRIAELIKKMKEK